MGISIGLKPVPRWFPCDHNGLTIQVYIKFKTTQTQRGERLPLTHEHRDGTGRAARSGL